MTYENLKLYIAVRDDVPDHMVPVLVAHAVLGAHSEFFPGSPNYSLWFVSSFKKVVLRVNQKEFNKIAALENVELAHENSTCNGEKTCAVLCPREEYPNVIKFAKMWKPLPIQQESFIPY